MPQQFSLNDENNRLIDIFLVQEGRNWPSWYVLKLWWRQGRPKDFPVITSEGTITARAVGVRADGRPEIYAEDISIQDWSFDLAMLPAGMMHSRDIIAGLCRRRKAMVTFPDGHTELWHLEQERERW